MEPARAHTQYLKRCMTSLILFICLSFSPCAILQALPASRILVLNSYHKGFPWVDNIVKGIKSVLEREKIDADLVIEYMDSKAVKYDTTYKEMLYKLYYYKYKDQKFDVIISSDDNAFNFLREYHQKIFPDAPIVFCGVNNLKAPSLINRDQFTGILEISGEKETIDLALKLHPETKHIVVVTDTTPSGKYYFGQIENHFNQFPDIKFSRIDDSISIEQIEDKMSKLSDETIALYTSMYRDKTGRYISLAEGTSRISKSSRRPIYIFHAQVLQYGTVGGKLLAGRHHGEKSAEMAIQILQGEKVSNIPIADRSIAQYAFDYQQLERFGIKSSDLPEESIIVNIPFSFYEEYKTTVWATILVVLVLTIIIIMLNLNITKRKRVGETLRESEERMRSVLETSPVGKNGKYTYVSDTVKSVLGYSAEELIGKTPFELMSAEEGAKINEIFLEIVSRAGPIVDLENWNLAKDGTEVCLLTNGVPIIDVAGEFQGYRGVDKDITRQKKLEAEKDAIETQFRQAQKMEAIGTLAGGIAHDFNNILTTILGNAQIILMEMGKSDTLREGIEEINEAGERAATLTRQLLAFSRKQIVQPEILDFNELLTGIEKMLGRLIGEDVDLLTIPGPELWQVETDPGQMEQITMNLAINAKDAMPMGGKLTIETANMDLDANYFHEHGIEEQPGPYVMLAVSDTGSGMDQEAQEHIFEPFYTTKEKGKGTGLGLSTVYGIVKQNNGFIRVYSEPGQGTTFKIYLPRVKGDVEVEKKERISAAELGGSGTILIVEDDDSLRKLAETVLKQRGYKVLAAENGEDALKISKKYEGSIELMLTDVVMPKMSGKKTAERLQPLYPHMKVIYMSGYTDDAIVHHGVLAPGLNFLEKPFSPESLGCKVREVLDD